jgi:putative ABC transport system permease protein
MNVRDLRLRVRALVSPRRVERELHDELAFHIERETAKHVANGMSPGAAREQALARFGSASRAAEDCRDARGTAVVETIVRDILYALRTFRRAPTVALAVIATVALGLGLSAAAFTIFNAFVFRVDAVRDADALFAVDRPPSRGSNSRGRFTRPQFEALRRETAVFAGAFARLTDITTRIDGRMMEGHLVTGNAFQVLGVDAALGRTLVAADDDRAGGQPVIVLSHAGWSRLFSNDPNVVGRSVLINGVRNEIVGVAPRGFRGLTVSAPDYWAPLSRFAQFRPTMAGRADAVGVDVIGRLTPGLSKKTALAGLAVWASHGTSTDPREAAIRLQPASTPVPFSPGALLQFSPLFFAFGSILMIGCANVANLLLARAVSRQREIGIRLSLGASRRRVVRQLMTESLLLAFAAGACAIGLARAALDGSVTLLMRTMPPEFAELVQVAAPDMDWRAIVFVIVAAIVATTFFGLVPALQATRLDLVRTVRGEPIRNARPGRARDALIVGQVTASALLLICAGVFLRSALRASTFEPGMRLTDTVLIEINNEPFRSAMLGAVDAEPSVSAVAAAWPGVPMGQPKQAVAGPAPSAAGTLPVSYRFVLPEYFDVLGIGVVRGRAFTQDEGRSSAPVAIVSDTTARRIWPNAEALGQVLSLAPDTRRADEPALSSPSFTVVGVIRDVAGFRIAGYSEAGVYVPGSAAMAEMDLIARVHGDPERVRRALLERLTAIDPNMGMVMTLQTLGRLETYLLQLAFCLTIVLGGLALALTLSGVFSVLSYLVEQRRKEIGVRITLGATTANVMQTVLSQSFRPVAIGLGAGASLAFAMGTLFMSTPAGARIGRIVEVLDPVAYLAGLLCITAACGLAASIPALRAARIDPIATLRED